MSMGNWQLVDGSKGRLFYVAASVVMWDKVVTQPPIKVDCHGAVGFLPVYESLEKMEEVHGKDAPHIVVREVT